MMGRHQLGRDLSDDTIRSIVAFLNALTGEIDADYIKEPVLPPSTDKTPRPDLN
jgi:cytochrome c peroxidase